MQLLVAMKERQAILCRRDIDFDLAGSFHRHNIL